MRYFLCVSVLHGLLIAVPSVFISALLLLVCGCFTC